MQVISSYLMKRIAEVSSPTGKSHFVPRATIAEWLDEVQGESTYMDRITKFNLHQRNIEVAGSPSMGWSANEITYQGATVTAKKEMVLSSLRFLDTNGQYFLIRSNDSDYKPFGDWNNSAKPCYKWLVSHGGQPTNMYSGTYTYTTYVNGEAVDTGTTSAGGAGVPSEDYTSQNASSSPPYSGCEVKELSCYFKVAGFESFDAGAAYCQALYNFMVTPSNENKQAVITALEDSVNP